MDSIAYWFRNPGLKALPTGQPYRPSKYGQSKEYNSISECKGGHVDCHYAWSEGSKTCTEVWLTHVDRQDVGHHSDVNTTKYLDLQGIGGGGETGGRHQ